MPVGMSTGSGRADALRVGLTVNGPPLPPPRGIRVETDPDTGLPAVVPEVEAPGSRFTKDELKDIEQISEYREDLGRAGLSL